VLAFVPTAARPFLNVPPVRVRVPNTPDVEIVNGGVHPPTPVSSPVVTVPEAPAPVVEQPFVQPTPVTPAVPVYPRKQARN
jgi:hypothetical protein